jgi:hypothetical protein
MKKTDKARPTPKSRMPARRLKVFKSKFFLVCTLLYHKHSLLMIPEEKEEYQDAPHDDSNDRITLR